MSEATQTIFPNLGSAGRADFATPPLQRDAARSRYSPTTRILAGTLIGVVASVLIIGSMQVGAAIAFHENGNNEWGPLMWGQHWAWRGAWGLVATCLAAFLG